MRSVRCVAKIVKSMSSVCVDDEIYIDPEPPITKQLQRWTTWCHYAAHSQSLVYTNNSIFREREGESEKERQIVGWARFNVPLDTAKVISETMFLQVRWPNQQCQSTEGGSLVIQIALNLTRLISPCYNNTTCMHIQDKDTQRNLSTVSEPSEMKQNLVD